MLFRSTLFYSVSQSRYHEDGSGSLEKEKIRNKFIYLGRFRNLNLLQKTVKKSVFSGCESTKYDSMFGCVGGKAISYKDFKTDFKTGGAAVVS